MKRLTRVERAARAIHADDRGELSHLFAGTVRTHPWSRLSEDDKRWYRRRAKAALGVKV